ncbi:MAG: hypothetical protein WCH61_01420 [bacterium]
MSQETPQKIKLTLNDTPVLPPQSSDAVVPTAAMPVSGDVANAPVGVKDPLSLRDTNTSRLKRIKMDSSGQISTTVVVTPPTASGRDKRDSTETVRLKVIREKRQGAAPVAAAHQTIRLRPPAEGGVVPTVPVVPVAETASSPTAETVHVEAAADTVTVPPAVPAASVPATPVPATSSAGNKISTATIKLRPGTLPTPVAGPVIAAEPTAAPGKAKHTIKIKMPAPVVPGAGATALAVPPDSGATIKLPASAGDAGATMKLPDAPASTGKRPLKFKMASKPEDAAAAATTAAATAAANASASQVAAGAALPDWLGLAASLVTVLALGVMLGLLVVQGLRYGL